MPEPASAAPRRLHRVEHVMGMPISLDIRDPDVDEAALDEAFAWLRHVDETFSTYKQSSQISRLNRGELGLAGCSPEVREILDLCDILREQTLGYFDIRANPAGGIDPSGMVKGWAVERTSALLTELGSTNHCINAGGDVRLRGAPAPGSRWRVGIVHPFDRLALTAVVTGNDLAVATSGIAERGLHVFNPHTGRAADQLASVTIVGPELTLTDSYATAALAMGVHSPEWLCTLSGREAYVIDAGGHVWSTPGWDRLASDLTAAGAAVAG